MFAFIVKWVGVVVVTLLAYRLMLKHVTAQSLTIGEMSVSFAAVVAIVVFFMGARLTVKAK